LVEESLRPLFVGGNPQRVVDLRGAQTADGAFLGDSERRRGYVQGARNEAAGGYPNAS
jgi:hypothetical protein